MCFAWISEQTAIISLYKINLPVFKTEAESVYCAVRIGSLNATATVSYLKGYSDSVYIVSLRRHVDVTEANGLPTRVLKFVSVSQPASNSDYEQLPLHVVCLGFQGDGRILPIIMLIKHK